MVNATTVRFDDPVYGEVQFTEPLLVDLYHAEAVQRLAAIYQGGITAFIRPERQTTRLEHSRGVAALLQRLGAGTIEQAAGLVHDVPHTAFSHVVDFVFPNAAHTYHEVHRDRIVRGSDLPQVMAKHALDWRTVTEAENFPLLEQPLPQLCADRLDYFLRDGIVDVGTFSSDEGQALMQHLRVDQGQIVVDDVATARWLGDRFIELDDVCWCSVQEVGWYTVMAEALRSAIAHQVISEDDFAGTDRQVMAQLTEAAIPEISQWLGLLRRDVDFVRVSPTTEYDLVALPKVRAVDPPVMVRGRVRPLSQIDPAFAAQRSDYIAGKAGVWYLRILA
ncbi:MAG: HD domain-containing protein [Anaerolineae bacterium]|nr:HD domain-containing protein [Anaerolineae bacterium]